MWLHVRLSSMTYEVKSLIDQGNFPNYNSTQHRLNSTQLDSRLTQRPYPIMITQIHYHLTRFTQNHPSPHAETRNPTRPGSSYENMWLHVRLSSMTYEVKSLIDQGNFPNYNSTQHRVAA
uniref:Uncharacterized protein n=1 Tax=Oryza punctata TaxID=4537 RepID=A0A0E0LAB2_ORYPU